MTVVVTGASGGLGGRVARQLHAAGVPLRVVVRDPARAPELPGVEVSVASYDDPAAMVRAFDGADALLLVSAAEHPQRLRQHYAAVDAAAQAQPGHVVYTSFQRAAPDATFTLARDHAATEQRVRDRGLPYTFLRDAFYQDALTHFPDGAGTIRGPAGEGRVAAVARDDVADSAVAVLLAPTAHAGATYELTGPQALSLDEVAETLTRVTGRQIRYERETVEQAYASRAHYGAAAFQLDAWVSTYQAIAAAELQQVTGDVQALSGHPATAFDQYLAVEQTWRHLAPAAR